jgi:YidC/Oxa1 family membrane protein insertase
MNSETFLLDSGFFGWLYKILTPIEWLMTQIMVLFHKFLVLIGMPSEGVSWILSIILLVLVVHACILPIFVRQIKSMRKMQALQPKMQHIQNKYKGKKDPASREAMSREMTKLYQDNGANPAGSCLPMLIQGPVFMCMFYTLSAIQYIANGKACAARRLR